MAGFDLDYSKSNSGVTIEKYRGADSIVDVPPKIAGLPVTKLGDKVFSGCTKLTTINLPESLTSIGNEVFSGCTGLTTINLPASLTSIGNEVFSGCTGLTTINLPASLTAIGNEVFSGCTNLTTINLPASLTSIGNEVFSGCTNLTTINLPESLTAIGAKTFVGCTRLREIHWHGASIKLGKPSFKLFADKPNAIQLPAFLLSGSIENFDDADDAPVAETLAVKMPAETPAKDFSYRKSNSGVTIENYRGTDSVVVVPKKIDGEVVSSIGSFAFARNINLKEIFLQDGLTSIGWNAFSNCYMLTKVFLPASLSSISLEAFNRCTGLKDFCVPKVLLKKNFANTVKSVIEKLPVGCKVHYTE